MGCRVMGMVPGEQSRCFTPSVTVRELSHVTAPSHPPFITNGLRARKSLQPAVPQAILEQSTLTPLGRWGGLGKDSPEFCWFSPTGRLSLCSWGSLPAAGAVL